MSRAAGMTDAHYIEMLTARLQEAEDVLDAIKTGSVDALFIQGEEGETVYTLDNADKPYRLLVEQMQEGAVTISSDGTILYANRRFGEIFCSPLEVIVGQPFQRYIFGDQVSRFSRYLANNSTGILRSDFKLVRADGAGFPSHLSFVQLPANFSSEPIYCGIITDLTEQKAMEAQLHHSQKMEALGQLTGGLAHDFNNLLQAIQGSFDLIIRRSDSEKISKWAVNGLKAADRGAKLTSQLLAFSRSQKLELRACSVNDIISGMMDLLRSTLGSNIQLDVRLEDTASDVMTDPVQLELAILNLTINSRDAMGGTGRLTLISRKVATHEVLESPLGFIEISVADTGVGMSEDTRQNALNPFFTTKDIGQGTGLGLSQVESITQQSKGAVRLASKLGEGTTIFLTFPCTDAATRQADSFEEDIESTGPKLNILVIDDDRDVRRILVDMLDALGHQGTEAEGGSQGLRLLNERSFDLVLLDYAMPQMSGAEVAREIHRTHPQLPIVFVSGYSNTEQLKSVMNLNTALLRKPFTIEGLSKVMEGLLQE